MLWGTGVEDRWDRAEVEDRVDKMEVESRVGEDEEGVGYADLVPGGVPGEGELQGELLVDELPQGGGAEGRQGTQVPPWRQGVEVLIKF